MDQGLSVPGLTPADLLNTFRDYTANPAATQADMDAVVYDTSAAVLGTYAWSGLPTPSAGNVGRVAVVTDLWGDTTDRVRCVKSGTGYYWKPVSSDSATQIPVTGNLTVQPMGHPQTIVLTGNIGIGVTRNFTLDLTNAWPGCTKRIRGGLTTLLGGLNILGTGLGSGIAMLLGGTKEFQVIDNGGGSLAWVQTA